VLHRVRDVTQVAARDGRVVDKDGLTVEDFALADNLMMIHALDLHGCPLIVAAQVRPISGMN
jgi:propanediol dehydratase large subunit